MTRTRPTALLLTAAAVAVILVAGATAAISAPSLPAVTPEELVASVLGAERPEAVSGELTATLGLGLPALPVEAEEGGLADLLRPMRLRLERSPDGLRAALLRDRSERLLVTDGRTLSTWDSRTFTVTQHELPRGSAPDGAKAHGDWSDVDPAVLAQRLVGLLARHGTVTVDGTARVAGRAAYQLALVPDDAQTTVGRVEVDVDEETRTALRVAVHARGATAPSLEVAWTRVSFDPVDPALFAFTPPPGAEIVDPGQERGHDASRSGEPHADEAVAGLLGALAALPGGPLVGSGFSTVAVLPLPGAAAGAAAPGDEGTGDGPDVAGLAALLPLDGPLLSARVADLGGTPVVLLGFVPLSHLDAVAAEHQRSSSRRR